jgi:CelD/BcsL family acetyltransferase involved in cellulose biosynthesis
MHIDIIDDLKTFTQLRGNWDAIYEADADAQFFLTWEWLSKWFKSFTSPNSQWFILAAKPTADAASYVAFFPLQLRTEMKRDGTFYNEVRMGGAELADYTGFLCLPEFEDRAIPAFAEYLRHANWAQLHLKNIHASKHRMRLFMKPFAQSKFEVEVLNRYTKGDNLNCDLYPYVNLPGDFETYLAKKLSSNTRQKAKRFIKKVGDTGEFRVTHADASTIKRDVDMLLHFWRLKWGRHKGSRLAAILSTNRTMLMGAQEAGVLFMPVLWKGDRPLGALGILVDRRKKSLHFLIAGRDETFVSPPPGFILHIYAIRWAIENGFTVYDFLQGNEPYKYMFGCEERRITYMTVTTRNKQNLGGKLDARSLAYVLDRATELYKKGKLDQAERGYRQVLDVEPEHPLALYLLGQLMAAKQKHADAEKFFKAFLAVKPDVHKAWLKLGKTLEAQGDTQGAVESYQKVLELDPGNRDVERLIMELSPLHQRLQRVAAHGR